MMDFNKIVKVLGKKGGKVLFKKDIFMIIDPEMKAGYQSSLDKIVYRLRAQGVILPLKAGVYILPDSEDMKLNAVDLLEKYYIQLIKKYITENVGTQYYISGQKSLEFHLKDYSIPKRITVINRSLEKKIYIGEYELLFRTISGGRKNQEKNLFALLYKYHTSVKVLSVDLKISCLELALLESAVVEDSSQGIPLELISKAIKKYHSIFREDIFREIGKYKYNMSFNRLKELSRHITPKLYKLFLDIIKKNGGCFVGEGLRNM